MWFNELSAVWNWCPHHLSSKQTMILFPRLFSGGQRLVVRSGKIQGQNEFVFKAFLVRNCLKRHQVGLCQKRWKFTKHWVWNPVLVSLPSKILNSRLQKAFGVKGLHTLWKWQMSVRCSAVELNTCGLLCKMSFQDWASDVDSALDAKHHSSELHRSWARAHGLNLHVLVQVFFSLVLCSFFFCRGNAKFHRRDFSLDFPRGKTVLKRFCPVIAVKDQSCILLLDTWKHAFWKLSPFSTGSEWRLAKPCCARQTL